MNRPTPLSTATLPVPNSISRSPFGRGLLFIALVWFALSPAVQAVSPAPDGGYAGDTTAEGTNALLNLTGVGAGALYQNTTGSFNTAVGAAALLSNTTGANNTAVGRQALLMNTTGGGNTANGYQALYNNTTGFQNTANGYSALLSNTTGFQNTADGLDALFATPPATTTSHWARAPVTISPLAITILTSATLGLLANPTPSASATTLTRVPLISPPSMAYRLQA
jgi:hypothetical protein